MSKVTDINVMIGDVSAEFTTNETIEISQGAGDVLDITIEEARDLMLALGYVLAQHTIATDAG